MSTRGQRLYDRWSRHRWALGLLYGVVFLGREAHYRRQSIAALSLSAGDRVLELGCGPGNSLASLREEVGPEGTVVALDYSGGMVAAAARRAADWENVHVVRGDARRLPADATFDAVYASMSLSAMADPEAVARAARRVLVPGGRVAVLDARPFQRGGWRLLNPPVVALSKRLTDWHAGTDVVAVLRSTFDSVSVTESTGGAVVVASAHEDGPAQER